jgi:hypothetical protein
MNNVVTTRLDVFLPSTSSCTTTRGLFSNPNTNPNDLRVKLSK